MIKKVRLKNWKSYRDKEFYFSKGVCALIGDIGSGKSSVLEGVVFGFFGTTPALKERRVSLDDLIRRVPNKEDTAEIEILFEDEGEDFLVERKIVKGKGTTKSVLKKDGELIAGPKSTEVTEKVEKILEITYDTFTSIIYSEQNSLDFFISLNPSDRKEKIDGLLGLNKFEEARSNSVTVKNRVKRKRKIREKDLKDLENSFDKKKIAELESKVEELEKELEETEKKKKKAEKSYKKHKNKFEELEEDKEKLESLEKKINTLKAKISSLKELIDDKKKQVDSDILEKYGTEEKVLSEQEKVKEKIKDFEKDEKKLESLKKDIESAEKDKQRLNKEIKDLKGKVEKVKNLEKVEKTVEKLEKNVESLKDQKSRLSARKESVKESIESLKDVSGKCPVCNKEMDQDHRNSVLKDKKEQLEELKEKIDKLGDTIKRNNKVLSKQKEKRDSLLKLKDSDKKLCKKNKELEKVSESKKDIEDKITSLKERLDEIDKESLNKKLKSLEKVESILKNSEKINKQKKNLEKVKEKKDGIKFDKERFKQVRNKLNDSKTDKKVLENKLEDKKEVLEQVKNRLEKLKDEKERIEKLSKEVTKLRLLEDFFTRFKKYLKRAQEELRKKFVSQLNQVMNSIWPKIYPYNDYQGLKIFVEDDYVLKVRDFRDNYLPVQGEVSGGERHVAALTLRLALSTVLCNDLNVLMLDEPTHNLDSTTITDLGTTLRDEVSQLVDQLILITHDKKLEDAVTSQLYYLEKNGSTGITEAEEINLQDV